MVDPGGDWFNSYPVIGWMDEWLIY